MIALNKEIPNPFDSLPKSNAFDWKAGSILPPETGKYVVFEPKEPWVGTVPFYKKNNRWGGLNACVYFYASGKPKKRFYWDYLPEDPTQR